MRESQAEIKAIEAQLRSIRAEPVRASSSQSHSSVSQRGASTVLEPSSTKTRTPVLPNVRSRPSAAQSSPVQSSPAQNSSVQNSSVQSPAANPNHVPNRLTSAKRVTSYPLSSKHWTPNDLEAMVDRLQEQSASYIQQFTKLQSQAFQTPEQQLDGALKILDAQVQHINQLSAVQENAILELKTIATQVEREWQAIECSHGEIADELDTPAVCQYVGTAVPQIEKNKDGTYVLSARSIDLFKAEREAALTAEALRHWANRGKAKSESPSSLRRKTRSHRRRSPSNSILRVKEAVALFLGAVLVRMVLNMVLANFPTLWIPAVAILVTPAAIAVYRGSNTPQSGLVWGYRLLVIMLGLLLGGRL